MGKEKSIETPELFIKGNIMKWTGTMIQMSNVSYISMASLALEPFRKGIIWVILFGIIGYSIYPLIGIALIVGGIGYVIWWYVENENRKNTKNLNIMLNSGTNLCIQIKDLKFLEKVIAVLEEIIIRGGIGKENNISINISDSQFEGPTSILNDLGIDQ